MHSNENQSAQVMDRGYTNIFWVQGFGVPKWILTAFTVCRRWHLKT